MAQSAYVFIGQSGCGKGTQAHLLEAIIKKDEKVLYLETGTKFRELIARTDNFTASRVRTMINNGKLPQPFLGIHAWTHMLIEEYDGLSKVIIDGAPRRAEEVPILLGAADFYNWQLEVVYIDVGDEWAYEKTHKRGRADDLKDKEVWGRIEWFHTTVVPTIELLEKAPGIRFHRIYGEQTIEEVHGDILRALNYS